ncbi:MAG: YaiO family outer membrane beta-barrel protein [Chromatiales bacterium]|nr:YaiO family outer membrane beta-barrel protein [Chromatiales bacterium]
MVAANPRNADYLLSNGPTLVWAGRPVEALPILAEARRLSPDYFDVWRVQAIALLATATPTADIQYEELMRLARTRFSAQQVAALPQLAATTSSSGYLDLTAGFGYQHLTKGRAAWNNADVGFAKRFENRAVITAVVSTEKRFDARDETLTIAGSYPLHERVFVNAEVGYGNDNEILPRYSLAGGVTFELSKGFLLSGAYKRNQYRVPKVEILTFGVEKYWADFRVQVKLDASSVEDSHQEYSRTAGLGYYYGEVAAYPFVVGLGPETNRLD